MKSCDTSITITAEMLRHGVAEVACPACQIRHTFRLAPAAIQFQLLVESADATRAYRLSPVETRLFTVLSRQAGAAIPAARIIRDVWGDDPLISAGILRTNVNRLRDRLAFAQSPYRIETVTGVGYRLESVPEGQRQAA